MKYRKRPVVVEAVQWNPDDNGKQIAGWPKHWKGARSWEVSAVSLHLFITTLEGDMAAKPGDWIIRGVAGEFYPCKPEIFALTYEPVEGTTPPADKGGTGG